MKRILLGLAAAAATAALASAAIAADKKTIVFIVNGPSDFWKIMEAAVAHAQTQEHSGSACTNSIRLSRITLLSSTMAMRVIRCFLN